MSSAATPATEGLAMLVPSALHWPLLRPPPCAERTATPVPTTDGASRPSAVGPWLLKTQTSPPSATAPTDSEFLAAATSPRAEEPPLPLATT